MSECRVFSLRAVGGQEYNVAFLLKTKVESKGVDKTGISALLVVPSLKGFVFVEARMPYEIQDLATGMRHFRGMVRGLVNVNELLNMISKPVEINVGDIVEIVVDPFRGYKGKVVDIDRQKNQIYLEILDSPNPMPIIVNIKGVRKIQGS